MTDLVERLRANVKWLQRDGFLTSAENTTLAADEIERLRKIEAAAKNLIAVKGRYHSEQAYKALEEALK